MNYEFQLIAELYAVRIERVVQVQINFSLFHQL